MHARVYLLQQLKDNFPFITFDHILHTIINEQATSVSEPINKTIGFEFAPAPS